LTLEDIGNIGEVIAAIATIATLAYLALQIKMNTKSVRGSMAQGMQDGERATAALIAQHANVYRRGNASLAELNDDEKVVYEQLIFVEIGEMWSAYDQHQNGLMTQLEMNSYIFLWGKYMTKPGFRSIWSKLRNENPAEFCQWLDNASAASKLSAQLPD
jgi:hypothetical protein